MLCSRLTVEFSPPWWVGTLERWEDGRYEVGRVVFGAEPTEPEVLLWVLHRLSRLRTTPAMEAPARRPEAQNPKRRQRQIAREQQRPAGKKAWAANTPSADGRGAPGGSPGTVPAAPAEAAAEAPGTLNPVCPAVHNTPVGTIPAGVFFISCAKIYNPLLVPLPQNPYDNRGTFIKRKGSPWQSIIPMPPDACPCPGGKS